MARGIEVPIKENEMKQVWFEQLTFIKESELSLNHQGPATQEKINKRSLTVMVYILSKPVYLQGNEL